MKIPLKTVVQRLEKIGVGPEKIYGLIRDVAVMVSAGNPTTPHFINKELKKIGWKKLVLDEEIIQMIIEGFKKIGHEDLEQSDGLYLSDPDGQKQLIDKIYQERGIDFKGYSPASLSRRFARRLQACGVSTYGEYLPLLNQDKKEYDRLINSIFVTVTRFYRNHRAFDALVPPLKNALDMTKDHPVKIWSAGCATGQEPYTIAMLAANLMDDLDKKKIHIIATDIDDTALEFARIARFSLEDIKDLPETWIQNYFDKKEKEVVLKKKIHSMVTFKHHNLVSDAPFKDLNIIICRNILIYFNISLQMRVIEKLYNGLKPKGHLLLGRYEMLIKQARRQYTCVDFDARLYRKK